MKFHVLTLFPEHIHDGLNSSIIKKAREKDLIGLNLVNIRDFAQNKHNSVDDYPYGGGAGMLMQPGPIIRAFESIENYSTIKRVIYMSPQGQTLNHQKVLELSKEEELVIICGHYEGIDERVIDAIVTEELSIGDYVLTGGEMAAMIVIDAVSRHIDGVLSNSESADMDSFDNNLLEYPQYTRPYEFQGMKVPDVLLSGNHKKIDDFRHEESLKRTALKRPDLLKHASLSTADKVFLENTCHVDKTML